MTFHKDITIARIFTVCTAIILAMLLVVPAVFAQDEQTSQAKSPAEFMKQLVGDWIGTCEQTTDGEQAENKFFHFNAKQVDEKTFKGEFTYYRVDEATRSPIKVGTATCTAVIQPDGSVKNVISGKGQILVYDEPKNEEHELHEVMTPGEDTCFSGKLTGKISVDGMPFGLGKNGDIYDGKSTWVLQDETLKIDQTLKASFKVLFFKKSFSVNASSVAQRGTDIVGLMNKHLQMASKPVN